MITVTVEVLGWLTARLESTHAGQSSAPRRLTLEFSDSPSLWTLLTQIAARHPRLREVLLVGDGTSVAEYVTVLVNDMLAEQGEWLDRVLQQGDRVTLLPSYSGGD